MRYSWVIAFVLSVAVGWLFGWNQGFDMGTKNGHDSAIIEGKLLIECKQHKEIIENQCNERNQI